MELGRGATWLRFVVKGAPFAGVEASRAEAIAENGKSGALRL